MTMWSLCRASGCGVCLCCNRLDKLAKGIMCAKVAINLANVFLMFSNETMLTQEQIEYMAEWCYGDSKCMAHLQDFGFAETQFDNIKEVVDGLEE